jgi:succinate-semialdehyde dehydrogenase/glutarate-semialdehyde dehydrogenase
MSTITASQEQQLVAQVPKQLYIGGQWRDGAKGTLPVEDPSTAEVLCEVADASVDDAKAALDAAVDAGPEFAAMAPRDRGEILRRAFELIIERKQDLATLMTLEMGKTVKESLAEIAYAAEFFRWFSEEAVRIDGRYGVAANGAGRVLTMKQPVGPCLMITPGTSRWRWVRARSARRSRPAARWSSSPPSRLRCRC